MENISGEKENVSCSPTTIPIQFNLLMLLKNSDCHKISFFNDGSLKLGHFNILDIFFSISGIHLVIVHTFMKSTKSPDDFFQVSHQPLMMTD